MEGGAFRLALLYKIGRTPPGGQLLKQLYNGIQVCDSFFGCVAVGSESATCVPRHPTATLSGFCNRCATFDRHLRTSYG
jgi:hypothetical protein